VSVLIFDIETIPSARFLAEPPTEEFLMKGVHANWKDETVEAHKEKQEIKWADEKMKYGSLDWRVGQILAASILEERGLDVEVHTAVAGAGADLGCDWLGGELPDNVEIDVLGVGDEEDLVHWMNDILKSSAPNQRIAGFNIRNFDLPWYYGRSAYHGVQPRQWHGSRYDPRTISDWADILGNYGSFNMWKLERYAKVLDLAFKPWGEGRHVCEWMARQTAGIPDPDYVSIARHVTFDVLTTWSLDQKFRGAFVG